MTKEQTIEVPEGWLEPKIRIFEVVFKIVGREMREIGVVSLTAKEPRVHINGWVLNSADISSVEEVPS
jgi:hypothetical protein